MSLLGDALMLHLPSRFADIILIQPVIRIAACF